MIIFEVCFIITGIAIYRIYFTVRRHKNQLQVQQIQVAQNSQMEFKCYEEDMGQKQASGRTHTVDKNENFHH